MKTYTVQMTEDLADQITYLSIHLNISKAEVIQRALLLFIEAVKAKEVWLTSEADVRQQAIIK